MRTFKTAIHTTGGNGKSAYTTCYKSYSLLEVGKLMNRIRRAEILAGMPKRKVAPITTYILEELMQVYFRDYADQGCTLEQIDIRDTNEI